MADLIARQKISNLVGRLVSTLKISALWNEAERQVLVSLPPIEVVVIEPASKALKAEKAKEAEAEKAVASADSSKAEGWGKRRGLGEGPSASTIAKDAIGPAASSWRPPPEEEAKAQLFI